MLLMPTGSCGRRLQFGCNFDSRSLGGSGMPDQKRAAHRNKIIDAGESGGQRECAHGCGQIVREARADGASIVAPWERATVYTVNQVAAACCGSLDESVIALNRLLVGKDLADSVGITGLMYQAVTVGSAGFPGCSSCTPAPR